MKQITPEASYLDSSKELSFFDVVHPLFKLDTFGVPTSLLGSCFPIGIGIYVTAAHVFEPFEEAWREYKPYFPRYEPLSMTEKFDRLKDMQQRNDLFQNADANCGALILDQAAIRAGVLKHVGMSLARHVIVFFDHDLALIFLHEDKRRNIMGNRSPIACLPIVENPKVGEQFILAGFPGKNNKLKIDVSNNTIGGSIGLGLVTSTGQITSLFPVKRDDSKCFFPCFSTTARMLSQHSGGPAISVDSWGVLGVNSTGFDGEDGTTIDYSVVSWIGKALEAKFDLPFDIQLGSKTVKAGDAFSLRTMADSGVIHII